MNHNKIVITLGVATPSFPNLFVLPFFVSLELLLQIF